MLDAGLTVEARPYIATAFINGMPLLRYCGRAVELGMIDEQCRMQNADCRMHAMAEFCILPSTFGIGVAFRLWRGRQCC